MTGQVAVGKDFDQAGSGRSYSYYAPANADQLIELGRQNRRQVSILLADGAVKGVNLWDVGGFDPARAHELAGRLAATGAVLLPGTGPQETGFWDPAVTTGDDGTARVAFTVPDRSTAWTLAAKGITVETLAGETTSDLAVKKDLFGELKLPTAFTDGDTAQVLATIHNGQIEKGRIHVTLKTTIAGRTVSETRMLDVAAKGFHETSFSCQLRMPEGEPARGAVPSQVDVEFELSVAADAEGGAAGAAADVVRQVVPLEPYGMHVVAMPAGAATSDMTLGWKLPKTWRFAGPSLQVLVGPSVEQSLIDIVLSPAPRCQLETSRLASGMESTTSDLLASLGLQGLLTASRAQDAPALQTIDRRIRGATSALVSSQNDDGGWSWTGRGGPSDRYARASRLALAWPGSRYKVSQRISTRR